MRTFILSLLSLSATPSFASESACAGRLSLVDRTFDFRTVVPREQLAWRGRPGAYPNRDREMRIINPPVLDLAIAPSGERAVATFRTGEVALFGDFEPKLLYAVPPTQDASSEYTIRGVTKVSWFDDEEFVSSREVRHEDSSVERLALTRGRVDEHEEYSELGELSVSNGVDIAAMRDGLFAKPHRSRETSFIPRDFNTRNQKRARFEFPERPILAVTPSRKRIALLDWFLTRKIARLYFWDPSKSAPPELAVNFRETLDAAHNIPDLTSVQAINEKQIAYTLKNNFTRPRMVNDGVYVYGKKLVRQKEFEANEMLLAVSDRGRFVLTLDRINRGGPLMKLWEARGKSFDLAHLVGEHQGEIDQIRMTENPARIWIFNANGHLRLIDLGEIK